ncbi:MAG: NAD-dependent epimerase/dehydratase family protein [candidate division Zixibacteria bacterium]|nr:NAD-dependent epimerase/dehydratase family protein [candidate division Zixibacteria bacterium]
MRKLLSGKFILLLLDILALQIAFFVIFISRYELGLLPPPEEPALGLGFLDYLVPSFLLTVCWLAVFAIFKFYRPEPIKGLFDEITRVITAVSIGIMIFAFMLYSTDFPLEETRLVAFVYWGVLLTLLVVMRLLHFRYIQPRSEIGRKQYLANLANQKRLFLVMLDLLFIIVSYWGAFQLRFGGELEQNALEVFANTIFMVVIVRFTLFAYFKVYSGSYKYASIDDLLQIIKAVGIGSVALVIPIFFIPIMGFPRSVLLIDSLLLIILTGGLRLTIRFGRELLPNFMRQGKRVLIIGAGDAGEMIIREMKRSRELNSNPVAIIDDDIQKKGTRIHNVPVVGDQTDIGKVVDKYTIEEIIIAIPSATNRQMRRIIRNCRKLKVSFKTVPPLKDIINDTVSIHQVRDIRVTDLMGRDPLNLNIDLISRFINGKRVLVTGAAGSIGSEICRQVMNFEPAEVIMVDRAENNLYDLQQELRGFGEINKTFNIADISNLAKMRSLFEEHKPHIVYHAAAFKHVPLMEEFPEEAVMNNIFGTKAVLDLALEFKVSHFILISTDKAVAPTSVMGATKKVTELLAGIAGRNQITKVISVRFGNVLDTDGSVVPLFRRQIERGGPITVTDPRVTRYFMTISEATLLVMEASAMGQGGQLFVLKMGEPVRILDLAKDMITLAGLIPNEDIEIEFVGMRPGEKMHEELFLDEERLVSENHEKMLIAEPEVCDKEMLENTLIDLHQLCKKMDRDGIIAKLQEIVPSYTPMERTIKNKEVKG